MLGHAYGSSSLTRDGFLNADALASALPRSSCGAPAIDTDRPRLTGGINVCGNVLDDDDFLRMTRLRIICPRAESGAGCGGTSEVITVAARIVLGVASSTRVAPIDPFAFGIGTDGGRGRCGADPAFALALALEVLGVLGVLGALAALGALEAFAPVSATGFRAGAALPCCGVAAAAAPSIGGGCSVGAGCEAMPLRCLGPLEKLMSTWCRT